jgi:hypothetical protein
MATAAMEQIEILSGKPGAREVATLSKSLKLKKD